MKLQTYLCFFLLESIPLLASAKTVFYTNFINVYMAYQDHTPGNFHVIDGITYGVNFFRPGEEQSPVICWGDFESKGLVGKYFSKSISPLLDHAETFHITRIYD